MFFEHFIVFKDDMLHLLLIREDLVKFCLCADLNQVDNYFVFDQNKYCEIDHLDIFFQKIVFSLKLCDFEKMGKLCRMISDDFSSNKNLIFKECYLDLKTIFVNLSVIFEGYSRLLSNARSINERNKNELTKKNLKLM